MVECACGCGGLMPRSDGRKYIYRHEPTEVVVQIKRKYVYIVKYWKKSVSEPAIWKIFDDEEKAKDFVETTAPCFYDKHEVE